MKINKTFVAIAIILILVYILSKKESQAYKHGWRKNHGNVENDGRFQGIWNDADQMAVEDPSISISSLGNYDGIKKWNNTSGSTSAKTVNKKVLVQIVELLPHFRAFFMAVLPLVSAFWTPFFGGIEPILRSYDPCFSAICG